MVKGLERFRQRFSGNTAGFVLIGGAACHEWFAQQRLSFRATKDLDLVVVIEAIDAAFVRAFRAFVEEGGYRVRERVDGTPELHRFSAPTQPDFPAMLELFSRRPDGLDLRVGQVVVPLGEREASTSLSAILLDDDYYRTLREHAVVLDGLPVATASVLVPLKARAWIDLTARRANGAHIDLRDADKHRNDVFRLAAILPGDAVTLPPAVRDDLRRFLDAFPDDDASWPAILAAVDATFGKQTFRPNELLATLVLHFGLDR